MIHAKFLKESTASSLKYWEKRVEEIKNGTFEMDGSYPPELYEALAHRKVEIFTEALKYAESLPDDLLISDKHYTSPEYTKHLRIVNQ